MKILELNKSNFAPFGTVLNSSPFVGLDSSSEFAWKDMSGGLELAALSCTGQLHCRYRDKILKKMEKHTMTPEIMTALNGDSLLCVASADCIAPEEDDLVCFHVKEGDALMMDKSVWHWIPYPLQDAGSRFLVLFRDGTGNDDLTFHELAAAVSL